MDQKLKPIFLSGLSWLLLLFPTGNLCQEMTLSRQIIFEDIGKQEGFPKLWTWEFLEDRQGFMWIGANGLYKYDGYTIQACKYDSISIGTVYALIEDFQNNMWIGASNGLFYYNKTTDKLRDWFKGKLDPSRKPPRICALYEDSAKRIWIGGEQALYLIETPGDEGFQAVEGIKLGVPFQELNGVRAIREDRRGRIFAATNLGLWRVEKGLGSVQYIPEQRNNPDRDFYIHDAELGNGDSLWLATAEGVWVFETEHQRFSKLNLPAYAGEAVRELLIDKDQQLWIGAEKGGLLRFRNGQFTQFQNDKNNPYSLSSNYINALHFDRFHNLWAGTSAGINLLRAQACRFPFYQAVPGPGRQNNFIFRILKDNSGGYWLRIHAKGLAYSPALNRECEILLQPPAHATIEEINDFSLDADGNVWVITLTNGLYLFENAQKKYRRIALGKEIQMAAPNLIIADLQEDSLLWISSKFGLCRVNRLTQECSWLDPRADLPWLDNSTVGQLEQAEDGNLWVTIRFKGYSIIGYLDKSTGKFVAKPEQPGHPSSVRAPHWYQFKRVPGNKIWAGHSKGLVILDTRSKSYSRVTSQNGLPVKGVLSITPDLEGGIWFTGKYNLCRFDGQRYHCFDASSDIESFLYMSSALGQDGQVLFGGANGLYAFYPGEIDLAGNTEPPRIVLTNFKVFNHPRKLGRAYEMVKKITVEHRENILTFEFSGLHFLNPNRSKYKYKLEGFQKDWVEVGSDERRATYTNLSPGAYTFHALAAKADGSWPTPEEGLSIQLIILPPWYSTWWAYLLCGGVIIGLLLGIRRHELKRHHARAEALRLSELDAFLQKVRILVDEELSNPHLDIDYLARELMVSRVQLYRKVKSMTGRPTSAFIRLLRLQKAQLLLTTTELNISEIAYKVGFTDPSYFTRVFREEYGMTPSEWRRR